MRTFLFSLCALLCGLYFCSGYVVLPEISTKAPARHLLGAKECTWGPSYWCKNLTAAAGCRAVPHCIQTVWVHQNPPPDTDSICQICVNMVTQARDQLQSNETQEELKEVFEGSCNLIPLKPIAKECDNLVDEFVPELVETLASEMNPQVVCATAGLCDNARIDAMLEEEAKKKGKVTSGKGGKDVTTALEVEGSNACDGCHTVVDLIEKKFNAASKSDLLNGFLEVCAHMSSFSDSCTNIILTYFPDIYYHIKTNLNSNEVCMMSGDCSVNFHVHADVKPLSSSGFIDVSSNEKKDDIPCALCEQLVGHLRDLLVANTTELEFQKVLEGICSEMKAFKQECLSIADEYYPIIYKFLLDELNSSSVCSMIGICPNNVDLKLIPVAPLLLRNQKDAELTKVQNIMSDTKPKLLRVPLTKADSTVRISESTRLSAVDETQPLPIERMSPQTLTLVGNTQLCTFCEYFLHYVQQAISEPSTEAEIKKEVFRICNILPKTINATCHDFVNTYGDAMVAILAQEIDPSQVCPMLSLCPSSGEHDVEVFMKEYGSGSPGKTNCPLCLFAVEELESLVKNNKTKQNVKTALEKLCSHLSNNLATECNDFVETYTNELIEMLMNDFTPQEVCVYLKLCNDTKIHSVEREPEVIIYGGKVATNEIPDSTINGKTLITAELVAEGSSATPQCILCEFVMSQIENQLANNKTDEAIKHTVLNICKHMPKTIKKECTDFVNQHGDQVIQLLIATMDPQKVCGMMMFCKNSALKDLHLEVHGCAICEAVVSALDKMLANPYIDHKIEHLFQKSCRALPAEYREECKDFIDAYGDTVFEQLTRLGNPGTICKTIEVCASKAKLRHQRATEAVGKNKCTWGPSHWCASLQNAEKCGAGAKAHCVEKVWKSASPP